MVLQPSFSTVLEPLVLAALGVVAGVWLVRAGVAALRRETAWRGIAPQALTDDTVGLVAARGRVALEGPVFAPLSGRPCAGFVLEVAGQGTRVGHTVQQTRPFRLVHGATSARVVDDRVRLHTGVTAERIVQPDEAMPAGLQWLEDASAELRWLRDRDRPLHLVERALLVDHEVVVLGRARPAVVVGTIAPAQATVARETLARTGTDDVAWDSTTVRAVATREPALWLEPAVAGEGLTVLDAGRDARMPGLGVRQAVLLPLGVMTLALSWVGLARVIAPFLEGWS